MSHFDDLLGIAALATLGWAAALLAPELLSWQADRALGAPTAALIVPARSDRGDDVQQSSLPSDRHPG